MPKIDAPTVAEHRARVQTRLVDAAEEILRSSGSQQLTAGAVSSAAGIARNSIYRYVDSVDDLRAMVVARYLPAWMAAVREAMETAGSAEDRVATWVGANLEQAAATGHGWLMEAVRTTPGPSPADVAVDQAHTGMRHSIAEAWSELQPDPDRAAIATALTVSVLDAGFRELDAERPAGVVIELGTTAARALVRDLRAS